MRHDISIEGNLYRLRPVSASDAALIVELRSDPKLNRFLHFSSCQIKDQLAWLAKYYEREGDYYFVIERRTDSNREGVIAVYDIDLAEKTGEWGRWILKPSSLAAVESAFLIYSVAFDRLRLDSVYCRTVAENAKVVSFHDSCGIVARNVLPGHFDLSSGRRDAVEHRMSRVTWGQLKPRLELLSRLIERKITRA